MMISTDARELMKDINAVRKESARERGDFFTSPAVPFICFSALVKVADESDYWDDEDARAECLLGLAMLAQLTRLMVLVSIDPKDPVSNERLAEVLGIEGNPEILAMIATAIGMSPAWPGSTGVH